MVLYGIRIAGSGVRFSPGPHMNLKNNSKKRPALQSIHFVISECCDSIKALSEMNNWVLKIRKMNASERAGLPITAETARVLLELTRDQLCVRLQNLFDTRKNIDSLKRNYYGPAIDQLEGHSVVKKARAARHNNISHVTRAYTPWPTIEEILNSDLKGRLESLKIGLFFPEPIQNS